MRVKTACGRGQHAGLLFRGWQLSLCKASRLERPGVASNGEGGHPGVKGSREACLELMSSDRMV